MATPQQRPPSSRSFFDRVVLTGLPCRLRTACRTTHSTSKKAKAMTARDALNAKEGTAPAAILCATKAVPQISAAKTA